MVFPIPQPWTKVAHPVSAGKDVEAQEASVERVIVVILIWQPVSASVLPEDLFPVKHPATGTGPTGRVARTSTPSAMLLDPQHIDTIGAWSGEALLSAGMPRRLAARRTVLLTCILVAP